MSETHTPTPEAKTSKPLPGELQPLEAGLNMRSVTALDKLNIAYQDKKAAEWKATFNRVFAEERGKDTRSGEARRLAAARADAESSRAAYAALQDAIHTTAESFMPTVDHTAPDFDPDAYADHYNNVFDAVMHVAEMDPSEWEGDHKEDGTLEGNGVVHDLINHEPASPDATETPEEKRLREAVEKREQAEEALKVVRAKKQEALATRQRTMFRGRKEAQAAFEAAEGEYIAKLVEYKAACVKEWQAEGKSAVEINEALVELTNQLAKEDADAEYDKLVTGGGKKEKLLRKYAELSTARKIGVTAVFALVGVGVGIATGGAGVLAAVGGAAGGALAASRPVMVLGVHLSKLYRKQSPDQLELTDEELKLVHDELIELTNAYQQTLAKEAIGKGDKIKRRALLWSMGSVAMGGLLGVSVSQAAEVATDRLAGWAGGAVGDLVAGPEQATPTNEVWSLKPVAETPMPQVEFDPSAYNIKSGEGWYQTFKDMGIPKKDWAPLLNQIGDDLAQIDNGAGRPLAYEMKDGQWGIRMTPDGKMPQEALELIQSEHQRLFGGSAPSAPTTGSESLGAPAGTVPNVPNLPEGVTLNTTEAQSLETIVHKQVIQPSDIPANSPLLNKLSYTLPNLPAKEFAESIGLPDRIWFDELQPHILSELQRGTADYVNTFKSVGGTIQFTGERLSPATIADLLNEIPLRDRLSMRVG